MQLVIQSIANTKQYHQCINYPITCFILVQ